MIVEVRIGSIYSGSLCLGAFSEPSRGSRKLFQRRQRIRKSQKGTRSILVRAEGRCASRVSKLHSIEYNDKRAAVDDDIRINE